MDTVGRYGLWCDVEASPKNVVRNERLKMSAMPNEMSVVVKVPQRLGDLGGLT